MHFALNRDASHLPNPSLFLTTTKCILRVELRSEDCQKSKHLQNSRDVRGGERTNEQQFLLSLSSFYHYSHTVKMVDCKSIICFILLSMCASRKWRRSGPTWHFTTGLGGI